jgi:hypothetical protein
MFQREGSSVIWMPPSRTVIVSIDIPLQETSRLVTQAAKSRMS